MFTRPANSFGRATNGEFGHGRIVRGIPRILRVSKSIEPTLRRVRRLRGRKNRSKSFATISGWRDATGFYIFFRFVRDRIAFNHLGVRFGHGGDRNTSRYIFSRKSVDTVRRLQLLARWRSFPSDSLIQLHTPPNRLAKHDDGLSGR